MKSFLLQQFDKNKKLFLTLIGIDLLFLLLHLFLGKSSHLFHLDFEYNLPTTYQSLKLVIFGLILFLSSFNKKNKFEMKHFVLPLSVFLVLLGFDEFFQLHENIYKIFELFEGLHPSRIVEASMKMGYRSSLWIIYYIPLIFIFVFWSGYWFRHFQTKMQSFSWSVVVSSTLLFTILLTEVLSSTGSYSENAYYLMVTIEETAEMLFASTLIHVGNRMTSNQS